MCARRACSVACSYELRVSSVHLLDWYGGMRIVPASEYYAATLDLGTQPQPQAPADGR